MIFGSIFPYLEIFLRSAFLPGFKSLFGIRGTLSLKEFLITVALAVSTLPVFEAGKAIQRAAKRKKTGLAGKRSV